MPISLELYVTPGPSSPDYERRLRLGAIRVRRAAADEARRMACDANLAGDISKAYRLHGEADGHEEAIERYSSEIGMIGGGTPRPLQNPRWVK